MNGPDCSDEPPSPSSADAAAPKARANKLAISLALRPPEESSTFSELLSDFSSLTSVFSSFAFTASSSAIAYAGIKSNVNIILSIFKALIPLYAYITVAFSKSK